MCPEPDYPLMSANSRCQIRYKHEGIVHSAIRIVFWCNSSDQEMEKISLKVKGFE
jgi:hypothetical protein